MTSNRIPDEISIHRPGPCTEVKLISGHYYVYMYKSVKLASGKWGKKTGKCIGSIIPEKGFVPNKNFLKKANHRMRFLFLNTVSMH